MSEDLATWLLEQIAEDERRAQAAGPEPWDIRPSPGAEPDGMADHIAGWQPARVLAECEAKRRIVEFSVGLRYDEAHDLHAGVLKLLALPYSDRSGYREEWAP